MAVQQEKRAVVGLLNVDHQRHRVMPLVVGPSVVAFDPDPDPDPNPGPLLALAGDDVGVPSVGIDGSGDRKRPS